MTKLFQPPGAGSTVFVLAFCLSVLGGCADSGGREIFVGAGCPQCHGLNGEGRPQGPPLRNLSQHWTRSRLAAYVANPQTFSTQDPRLKALEKKYGAPMPSFLISEGGREQLAEYLLGLK